LVDGEAIEYIGKHTVRVMTQFEKYFSRDELPGKVDVNLFRLILAVHDLGKLRAEREGDKGRQHDYTGKIIARLFSEWEIDERSTNLALGLTAGDPIGLCLRNKISLQESSEKIKEMATQADLEVDSFFDLLQIFYMVDVSSYSREAGYGNYFIDRLFSFDHENWRMSFSEKTKPKIEELRKQLNQNRE